MGLYETLICSSLRFSSNLYTLIIINFNTMKSVGVIFKSQLIALLILLSFYSCDDIPEYKLSPKIEDDPLTTNNFSNCLDHECDLLTNDRQKEWKLVKIINPPYDEIPYDMWSDCDKSETITFTCNYTFQRKCFDPTFYSDPVVIENLELITFSWSITESYGKKVFYLQLISDAEPPPSWMDWLDDLIFIQELTDDIFKIMVDGRIREYRPDYWEPGWDWLE